MKKANKVPMTSLFNKNYDPNDPSTDVAETSMPANLVDPEVQIVDPSKQPTTSNGRDRQSSNSFNLTVNSSVNDSSSRMIRGTSAPPVRHGSDNSEDEEELVLKYGAEHVIKIFKPVSLCLILVIICLSLVTSYQSSDGRTFVYTPFNEDSQSSGTKLWMSIANASIFIGVVVVMTILLIVLYKYSCYKVIHGWLAFSSFMLLFLFTYMFISELFKQFNLVTDMITVTFVLFNFGVLGMFAIHWKGPLVLQQAFLIFTCIQMALIFIKYLPEWTTWVLLAFISIWDLIAVLCPFGPLRILVETAKSRNDQLFPAMVYSSAVMYTVIANMTQIDETKDQGAQQSSEIRTDQPTTSRGDSASNQPPRHESLSNDEDDGGFRESNKYIPAKNRDEQKVRKRTAGQTSSRPVVQDDEPDQPEEEGNGVKLGLGDFIFYSILVGKASILGDWNTVVACFIAILIGLCMTLILLAIFRKPLPALPISLFFGLIFYFSTNLLVRSFYDNLAYKQYFI